MQLRLRALVPTLCLTALAAAAVGVWAGMRFHAGLANALPANVSARLHLSAPDAVAAAPAAIAPEGEDYIIYTCGMHPQVQQSTPGNCPICGMPLQAEHTHRSPASQVKIDPVMVQNMGVRTAMPMLGHLQESIRAVGTLTEPEEKHRVVNLRVSGWIEKLYADQEGMSVEAGAPLFELYSPEITAAADELIAARKNAEAAAGADAQAPITGSTGDFLVKAAQGALAAARRKLSLLGLNDSQVAAIEKLDQAPATITIVSPMHGHVAAKHIIEGSAVKAGDDLLTIADRSTMWMIVQVFEAQLGEIKLGQKVMAHVDAFPGKDFAGTVDFVYPHLDSATRAAQVRVLLDNAAHALHENMFAQAEIDVEAPAGAPPHVLIPREAVLDTGERQMVFLAEGGGKFEMRLVTLGHTGTFADAGDDGASRYVEVLTGLTEDDRVVTSGQFLLDSESRLEEARRKFETPDDNAAAPVDAPAPAAPAGDGNGGGM